jgi:diguanylate cyclase (GGDEF)-like protein/PAS domain S-box-containing protein
MISIRQEFIRLLAVATGPLVLVLGYTLYNEYQLAYRDAKKSAARIAEITAVATQDLITDVRANLDHLARVPQIRDMDPARCGSVVKDLQAVDPRFVSIITTDRDGYFVCSANALPPDRKLRVVDLEMLSQVVDKGEFRISRPLQVRSTGRWVQSFAAPVRDASGRIAGTVAIGVDLISWHFLAKAAPLREGTVIGIVAGDGTTIARSERAEERIGRSALDSPAGRAALQIRNGTLRAADRFGVERLYAFRTVPGTDWIAAVGFPMQVVQAESRKLLIQSGALVLLSLILAAIAAMVLMRRIIAPIRDMARVARAHAAGETETRIQVAGGPSELVELAEDMNRSTESRVAAEGALRRAQQMAQLAHVITGLDGAFESWSDTLPTLIGIKPDRMPKSTREWLENLHPDDRAALRDKAIEAGSKGTRTEVEYRLRRADSEWIHVRQVMEPLQGQAGPRGKARWFNTLQDVTGQKRAEESLRRSESLKGAVLASSLDAIVTIDGDGRFVEFNPAAETMFGMSRNQALGKSMVETIVPAQLRDAHRRGFASYLATSKGRILGKRLELSAIRADGTEFPIELAIVAIGSKAAPLFTGFISDISERKEAEQRIKRLNRVYAVLSGINALIVRVRDRDELFREACRIAVEVGKFSAAWMGVLDRSTMVVEPVASHGMPEHYIEAVRGLMPEVSSGGGGFAGEAIREKRSAVANDIVHDPRAPIAEETSSLGTRSLAVLPCIVAGEVVGVLSLHAREPGFFDAEEMKLLHELAGDIAFALDNIEKQERIDYLAYYDSVTGLANRTLFHERLEQGLAAADREGRKLPLIILDIERFKTINDTLGRHGGDALLKQIADRMALQATGVARLARLGADHFAIMAPHTENVDDLGRRTEERLEQFFGQPFRIGEIELTVAVKLGIAVYPDDGIDADTLFKNAEAALRNAKASGERYLFYTRAMNERVAEKMSLENKLRQALEKEEFVLHYQPKVDLVTRRIVGVEALIRWQSPELGLVPPMQFIPLLEETGLILPVGAWALKKASLDHRCWVDQGLKAPRVAVNVSPIQLRQRDFVGIVEQAIMEGVAPTGIDLEITESLIMEDVAGNIEKLKAIRALGLTIAIDDFGTGYSSLGYLAKLPAQTLKIDRSFIITMLNSPDTMTLVSTIISLAHSLKLKVVAEGVDAEDQAKMLQLLRCDEMQGYLFSRPVPFERMTTLLTQ